MSISYFFFPIVFFEIFHICKAIPILVVPLQDQFVGSPYYNITIHKDIFSSSDNGTLIYSASSLPSCLESSTSDPTQKGSLVLGGKSNGIAKVDNAILLSVEGVGFSSIDISDESLPQSRNVLSCCGSSPRIICEYEFCYVGDGNDLVILNVTDPFSPIVCSRHNGINLSSLAVVEDVLFISDSSYGLKILNISNKSEPYEISNLQTDGSRFDLYYQDQYVYFADGYEGGWKIIDVTNLASPIIVSNYRTESSCPKSSLVDGNYAYLGDKKMGLKILDISNKADPFLLSFVELTSDVHRLEKRGSFIYVGQNSGFSIIDVSNPSDPKVVGEFDSFGDEVRMTISQNVIFMGTKGSGLLIYEFGNLEISGPIPCGMNESITIVAKDETGGEETSFLLSKEEKCQCFGFLWNESAGVLCGGNGWCVSNDSCACRNGYLSEECDLWSCFGHFTNDTDGICSDNQGSCISLDRCECNKTKSGSYKYFGDQCQNDVICYNKTFENENLCSGHGECGISGNCTCDVGYIGYECGKWKCGNYTVDDVDNVCGGKGVCYSPEKCFCLYGYYSDVPLGPCVQFYCGEYHKDDPNVCSGRGTCSGSNRCVCREGYESELCESWSCDVPYDDPLTCSGRGSCVGPDDCECPSNWKGVYCEKMSNGAVAGIVVPLVLIGSVVFCFLMLCVIVFFIVAILICISCCFVFCYGAVNQAKKVKRYQKLKNLDILLKEQDLEEDDSIAHIRIKKDLYTIPFDDIKVQSMLGQGGSNSVVFLATWKGRDVAFKCFKTRLVCSTQNTFDDFEKEVQVLASLSFPNIIRFYGATMKPPRVGIVMEYAENGDLTEFLQKYRKHQMKEYSQNEKIRMCYEIALSMSYLHSKNIVHRDLKSENILITEHEETRLMDFGLSKIVEKMQNVRTTKIGTNIYMAPEVILSDGYTNKCDIFSFSILMYIVITEDFHPYGEKEMMIEYKVSNDPHFRPDIGILDSKLSEEKKWIRDLVTRNWRHQVDERNSFSEITEIFRKENVQADIRNLEDEDDDEECQPLLKRLDFDDVKSYHRYVENQIETYKNKISLLSFREKLKKEEESETQYLRKKEYEAPKPPEDEELRKIWENLLSENRRIEEERRQKWRMAREKKKREEDEMNRLIKLLEERNKKFESERSETWRRFQKK